MPYPNWGETYGQFAIESGDRAKIAARTDNRGMAALRQVHAHPLNSQNAACIGFMHGFGA